MTDEGKLLLRSLIIDYMQVNMPTFHTLVGEEIDIEIAKACKEILRGTITTDIITERIMQKIEPQIPKKLYDIATNGQETEEDITSARDFVLQSIKYTVTHDVNKLTNMFKNTMR